MLVFPDTIGVPEEGREQLLLYAAATFNAFGPRNAIFERGNAAAARRDRLGRAGLQAREPRARRLGHGALRGRRRGRLHRRRGGTAGPLLPLRRRRHHRERHRPSDPGLRDAFPTNGPGSAPAPNWSKRAFDESLRWDSTVQTFFRTTTRDVEVDGVTIPEGAKVLLFLAAANRDPRKWDDPDDFRVERVASGHVGFGFGIHQCLGQMVARLEGELVLNALLKRVKSHSPCRPARPPPQQHPARNRIAAGRDRAGLIRRKTWKRPSDASSPATTPPGQAIIQEEGPPPRVQRIGGEHGPIFYEVWNTRATPAPIDRASGEPAEDGIVLAPPRNGTRIRVLDIPPEDDNFKDMTAEEARAHFEEIGAGDASSFKGAGNPATPSCTAPRRSITASSSQGEIVLIMDEGETLCRAGDIVVQRGTNHGWANRSDANCRIAFILIDGAFEDGLS